MKKLLLVVFTVIGFVNGAHAVGVGPFYSADQLKKLRYLQLQVSYEQGAVHQKYYPTLKDKSDKQKQLSAEYSRLWFFQKWFSNHRRLVQEIGRDLKKITDCKKKELDGIRPRALDISQRINVLAAEIANCENRPVSQYDDNRA